MRIRSTAARLALVAGLALTLAGCSKLNEVRAVKAFKDGNKMYKANDWRAAAAKYEEVLRLDPDGSVDTCGDSPGCVYFYLANSYDNLYRPTRKGQPENDQLLEKAFNNYKLATEKISNNAKMKQLSLQYLVATLQNPEKLNDPTQAEPILQQMIQLDPSDTANYFQLARLYEDSGEYELAEQTFLKAREVRPNDPAVYMQLVAYYGRQGDYPKTIEALQRRIQIEPNNPEAYYTAATVYWDVANRDFRLSDAQKRDYINSGLQAVDRALQIKDDYVDAYVYKGLLLRLQALVEKDPKKQQELLREADALQKKATDMRKKAAAGAD